LDENYNKKQLLYKQKMNIFYYDVAVSLPLRQCFTYKSLIKIKKGVRVSIPFGNRKVIGVVVKKINTPEILNKTGSIKSIISVLDEYPIFDSSIFKTILWASDYYHHPIGEVFHSFIPTELRKINNKFIAPIESNENLGTTVKEDDKTFNLTHDQNKAITRLSKTTGFDPSLLYGVTGSGKTEVYLRLTEYFIRNRQVSSYPCSRN
jgi:primosomal protein N' (replication factor Y)